MEDFVLYNELYMLYKDFLTKNEQEIFDLYYGNNLSMQEIADNMGVSKSYIGKKIKEAQKKLNDLENKIHQKEIKDNLITSLEENEIDAMKKDIQKIIAKM